MSHATIEHLIDGRWVPGDGAEFASTSPARPEIAVAAGRLASSSQVAEAIAAADAARAGWAETPMAERATVLRRAADILRGNAAEWGAELAQEEGKTLAEGIGEVNRAAAVLDFQAGESDRDAGEIFHSPRRGERIEVVRKPVGVVSLITPFNFPIAIPAWKAAPALIHGNTVVWKPAQTVPLLAMRLAGALHDAGLPPGVLNLVASSSADASTMLVDPRIRAVTFTGSTKVGRTIAATCAAAGIPVQAEMGGKNPAVVLADADIPHAASQVIAGAFNSTGQKCTATSRVAVVRSVAEEFLAELVAGATARVTGDPLADGTSMGPMIDSVPRDDALAAVRAGVDRGAEILCGGNIPEVPGCAGGHFMEPTIVRVDSPEDALWRDELFAPVLAVLVVEDAAEAFRTSDLGEYGLTAAVFTDSLAATFDAIDDLEVGILHVNSESAGADPHVPFGGAGASGLGPKEQGRAARDFFTRTTTIYLGRGPR
ncbi:aldehyde dehydrogenase [Corynebacterium xerosis]|uniref:aldehyde dehydrogenase family protein n=1 Tax=Corynebacterium xerosis TaxID=1725 RepID=UPI0006277C85|nr:aldehyde dehydrogenase family protein [Corynebacterium xerosis]KKO82666.1 aldehyde dehydrogenase [Corynebacterium xerosis]SQB95828.1 NADP-dependent glyceraldehyde-3-phosphate dehydrogenase [Clostridium paraputrificum]